MKILYLDCGMGAAGDMLTAALTELLPNPDAFIEKLNRLPLTDVRFVRENVTKCGITGTHMTVSVHGVEEDESMHDTSHGDSLAHSHVQEHHHHYDELHSHEHNHDDTHSHEHHYNHDDIHGHEHHHNHGDAQGHHHNHDGHGAGHHHSSMHEIENIVSKMQLPPKVQIDVLSVYRLIAEAESHVHGVPVTEIHFHEVGTMDAIADITAVCLLINELAPDKIIASPIHVGSGQVKCAHGILPVPAPATAYILRDVPIYSGNIKGELCTPTGAALLKHFADDFGNMPLMKTQAIGYGMGKKDFPVANCIRAMLGETEGQTDAVLELSCNVDDMTAESISFAMERFFDGGALEVYTIPIGMKKSRPGTLIRIMCREQDRETLLGLIFKHTTTIGVRESVTRRYVLERSIETVHTPYGDVRRKVSSGYGVSRSKYEYDDLSRIAKEQNLSLEEVKRGLEYE